MQKTITTTEKFDENGKVIERIIREEITEKEVCMLPHYPMNPAAPGPIRNPGWQDGTSQPMPSLPQIWCGDPPHALRNPAYGTVTATDAMSAGATVTALKRNAG